MAALGEKLGMTANRKFLSWVKKVLKNIMVRLCDSELILQTGTLYDTCMISQKSCTNK